VTLSAFCLESKTARCADDVAVVASTALVAARAEIKAARIEGRIPGQTFDLMKQAPVGVFVKCSGGSILASSSWTKVV
jgi:hypothetical protein